MTRITRSQRRRSRNALIWQNLRNATAGARHGTKEEEILAQVTEQRDLLSEERDALLEERGQLIVERDELIRLAHEQVLNSQPQSRADHLIPGFLFNTLPKSASVFVLETLAQTLDKPTIQISPGYFPRDQIDFRKFHQLLETKSISQSHVDAAPFNQRYLLLLDKAIVQFRDPRQATLSWTHHIERLKREEQDTLLFSVNPPLPGGYFELEFNEKLDFQLAHYLPFTVQWMQEWITFIEDIDNPDQFMISTYESFIQDRQAYFSSLLKFLGVENPERVELAPVTPTTEKNYRNGTTDEWKNIFSGKQITYSDEKIPRQLRDRFNWN